MVFDFGGVIADEGFRGGLRAIAAMNHLDPDSFFVRARDLIYETEYLTGRATEQVYWDAVRRATGIRGDDEALRREVLSRFIIRPSVLREADQVREGGFTLVLLSDQTDWLEEIDRNTGVLRHFDRVFNSFHLGRSKRDERIFPEVARLMGAKPGEILFIDDDPGNVERARSQGWHAVRFTDAPGLARELARLPEAPEGAEVMETKKGPAISVARASSGLTTNSKQQGGLP